MTIDELMRLLYVARLRPLADFGRATIRKNPADIKGKRDTWTTEPLTLNSIEDAVQRARVRIAKSPGKWPKVEPRRAFCVRQRGTAI